MMLRLILYFSLAAGYVVSQKPSASERPFSSRVENPTYGTTGPAILFDEAHSNFHSIQGEYKPFADLVTSDGYRVTVNRDTFSEKTLAGHQILLIVSAGGRRVADKPRGEPAFTEKECKVVREWVRAGGSLLLIADHWGVGASERALAAQFGVDMTPGTTSDSVHFVPVPGPDGPPTFKGSWLVFTRDNGLLRKHAITLGRTPDEHLNRVVTWSGTSLKGPKGSVAFLALSGNAVDVVHGPNDKTFERSAKGRAQGIALDFGKGRVAVLGEAGMFTAQEVIVWEKPFGQMGMSSPGVDNRQLALNILHWLSRLTN